MKEKYIKPTIEIISLPEEEFFTASGDRAFSLFVGHAEDPDYAGGPTVKSTGFFSGSNGNGYFD